MINELLSKMSLKDKIGQLLCVNIKGIEYKDSDKDYQGIVADIRDYQIGGLILFHGDSKSAATLLNSLQRISNLPLLVGSDIERGLGQILKGGTEFPTNMAFGSTFNKELTALQASIVAKEARIVGIHVIFAPVADVNSNPLNPIINTRSYGEDPQWVSAHVSSYIKGAQTNGALATAKHFPGHGEAEEDSHATLPVLNISRERFHDLEAIPFQAAIQENVGLIMSAHIAFPDITADRTLPATLSKEILSHLLRDNLSFKGLIVTDALNMAGVRQGFSEGESAVSALEAGADILLYPTDIPQVVSAILDAVDSGRLSETRIDSSVQRILTVKEKLGLFTERFVDLNKLSETLQCEKHQEAALRVARQSITLLCQDKVFQPFNDSRDRHNNSDIELYTSLCQTRKLPLMSPDLSCQTILFDEDNANNTGETFIQELSKRNPMVRENILLHPDNISRVTEEWLSTMEDIPFVIGIFSKIVSWKERAGLSSGMLKALNLILQAKPTAIVISFASPYIYNDLYQADLFISTYSHSEVSQRACAEALFGEIPFQGIMPVSLKGYPFLSPSDRQELTRRYGKVPFSQ